MSDLSDFDDNMDELEDNFSKATKLLEQNSGKVDEQNLLKLYGFYKQATVGSCNISKPGLFNLQAKAKWNAWNILGEMNKNMAKEMYVSRIAELLPEFNKISTNKNIKSQQWVAVSSLQNDENEIPESSKNIFDFVKESNVTKLKDLLSFENIKKDINTLDETGLGLIHWASDRGDDLILEILLKHDADVNLRDVEGQTSLHYAASCGNVECIKILLKYNADKNIKDEHGMTCFDVAIENHIKEMLCF